MTIIESRFIYHRNKGRFIKECVPDWIGNRLVLTAVNNIPPWIMEYSSKITSTYFSSLSSYRHIVKFLDMYSQSGESAWESLREYTMSEVMSWKSFNDFFTRKMLACRRPITNYNADQLLSPADSKVVLLGGDILAEYYAYLRSIYKPKKIVWDNVQLYNIKSAFICRLAPTDNHRFNMPTPGIIRNIREYGGTYLSVHPKVTDNWAWFSNYQLIIDIEWKGRPLVYQYIMIGATLVSSIVLHEHVRIGAEFECGDELGYFQYGSTILLTFPVTMLPYRLCPINNATTGKYIETQVCKNEPIGIIL